MTQQKDAYDEAIEYLTAHPNEILDAWDYPARKPGGVLFSIVSKNNAMCCGCLVQIAGCAFKAQTPELTAAILADKRIPTNRESIRVEDLPVFAEWQRRIDHELGRVGHGETPDDFGHRWLPPSTR